jgi:C4-dicarboxylate-specific signal transduction histidine kinase
MPSLLLVDPPGHHADALPAETGHAVTRGLHRLLRTRHAFWKLFVPLLLLVLGTGLFSVYQLHLASQARFYSIQQLAVDNREAQLQEAFDAYLSILRAINQDAALQRYIQTPSAERRRQAEESLYSAIQSRARLTQLRWIDETGMERLRINQSRHVVTVVPPAQLQYKGDRYYFKEAMALGPNEVYVSPLDLNVENGEIEYPVVPTLRLALQVQNAAQQPRGILIVNVDASAWLDNLPRESVWEEHSHLLNADGYWLRSSNPADEWGFMLPHKASFAQRYPQLWQRMQAAPTGSHLDARGHWIWRRLNLRPDNAALPVGQAPVLIQVSMLPNTAAQQVLLGMALYILPVMAISLGLLGYVLHWLVNRSQRLRDLGRAAARRCL